MANNVIFMDGAERGNTDLWSVNNGVNAYGSPPSGFTGNYYFAQSSWSTYMQKDFGQNYAELWFHFLFRFTSVGVWVVIGWTDGAGTRIGYLKINASGYLTFYRGATLVATGTKVFNINTVYRLECYYKPHGSLGIIRVKIDSIPIYDIDYSGNTTGGNAEIRRLHMGSDGGNNSVPFDDMIVDSINWTGPKRIAAALVPTGVGYQASQWTPSTGANWDCVNEIPPSDADYNWTNAVGQYDWFTLSNIAGNIASIFAVQASGRIQREGVPVPAGAAFSLRTYLTNYVGNTKFGGASFIGEDQIWMQNPKTNLAWTETEINNLEIGYYAAGS